MKLAPVAGRLAAFGCAIAAALALAGPAAAAPALDLENLTVAQEQQMMQSGQLTSVDLTRAYMNRIAALNHRGAGLNAVRILNPQALTDAALSDYQRAHGVNLGAMMGIPLLLKDNIDVAGLPTTAGSVALENSIPKTDSPLAANLRKAGAIILGKTNLSEFANFITNTNPSGYSGLGGQVIDAIDADQNPSGSSSGSAAAAASALAAVTIGTETSGSIISPSSTQGVVGLRPTVGLVSRTGILPISASQDTAGPITRTVADAATLLQAMAGPDPADSYTATQPNPLPNYLAGLKTDALNGKRIGIITSNDAGYQLAITTIRALGATTVSIPTPTAANIGSTLDYEFKVGLNAYLARLGPSAPRKSLADIIAFNTSDPFEAIKFGQTELTTAQALDTSPGSADTATYQTELAAGKAANQGAIDNALKNNNLDALMTPATTLIGIGARAGYPQITVPAGYVATTRRADNISFNGTAYSEASLLAFAYAFEQATKLRQPASQIDPSLYRCSHTDPPSPFAARGSCGPDVSVLNTLGAVPALPFSLETETAQDEASRLAAGTLSSVALTKNYLARIAETNLEGPTLNAVRDLNPDALNEAAQSDARLAAHTPRSTLDGLPVLVADNLDVAGMPTTDGSVALDGSMPAKDSAVVSALRAAGAVILGKTNVTEFGGAMSTNLPAGYSSLGGQVLDPYDADQTPNGPSSGSAAATGAGLAALTIGSAGAGSIVSPGSTQSSVALQPTVGLVSRTGMLSTSLSQDTAGPIGRSVHDVAAALQAIAGPDASDPATGGQPPVPNYLAGLVPGALSGKRIGVIANTNLNYQAAVAALTAAGATTVSIPTPTATSVPTVTTYETKRDLNAYLGALPASDPVHSLADVIAYDNSDPVEALKYGQGTLTAAQALDTSPGSADTTTHDTNLAAGRTANRAAIDNALTTNNLDAIMTPATTLVTIASRAGYPQLTVPAGYDTLNPNQYTTNPVGVTFTGTAFSEAKLLAVGYGFEQATQLRKPASMTNPSLWRCVPGSAFVAHSCAPGDLANPVPSADVVAGDVGGTVAATLSLTLGTPASFGAFTPGVGKDYTATMSADVISTAGDATLTVSDPSTNAPGHLVNGTFTLPQALRAVGASPAAATVGPFTAVGASPLVLLTYSGPVANDPVTLTFLQTIGANDALRTGTYSKTLTFTLATTNP